MNSNRVSIELFRYKFLSDLITPLDVDICKVLKLINEFLLKWGAKSATFSPSVSFLHTFK